MEKASIAIRPMTTADIQSVVQIHFESFPTSRSSRIGKPFLSKMYEWYVLYQPTLSFVATLNGEIVGFVTGAIGGGTARRRFRYAFWQIIWGFLRHPQFFLQIEMFEAWEVHLRGLFVSANRVQDPGAAKDEVVKVTLDSIAVTPHARGRDAGRLLVSAFEQSAQEQGATILGLGVESDNQVARHFYERCGWRLTRDDIEHNSANYAKDFQTS